MRQLQILIAFQTNNVNNTTSSLPALPDTCLPPPTNRLFLLHHPKGFRGLDCKVINRRCVALVCRGCLIISCATTRAPFVCVLGCCCWCTLHAGVELDHIHRSFYLF